MRVERKPGLAGKTIVALIVVLFCYMMIAAMLGGIWWVFVR